MRALVILALAGLLAGCTAPEGLGLTREQATPEPYFKEYREVLAGEHHKTFTIPVEAGGHQLNLVVELESRHQGLPLPGATPATLRVVLVDPEGIVAKEGTLDVEHATLVLQIDSPLAGAYETRVDGFGAAQDLDGATYGAGYRLSTEVRYAP